MLKPLLGIARFTVIEAVRTRLPWVAIAAVVACVLVAEFAAALALTDSEGYRTGTYAALSRLSLVFIVALFVATSVVRELQDRVLDLTLSRPVPRAAWFLGRLAGFGIAAAVIALLACVPLIPQAPAGTVAAWGGSFAAELWLVAAACLTCVVTLNHVTLALTAVAAFYVLSRAMGAIVLMSTGPAVDPAAVSTVVIEQLVAGLALLLPPLDRYAQAAWLLAGPPAATVLAELAWQTAIYSVVLIAVGLFDFYRREY